MGCSSTPSEKHHAWAPGNEEKLDQYLQSQNKLKPSVAVFDWDNTVIKNDVGDAVMLWLLKNDLILRPTTWIGSSKWLTQESVNKLNAHCSESYPETPLITSMNKKCHDTIYDLYFNGKGWKENYNKDTMEPAYAWLASLLAHRTDKEVRAIAKDAIQHTPSVQIYPQMKKLIADLLKNKVDVWVVSASPETIVEVFAEEVGLPPEKVIGIRNVINENSKYTAKFQGCGTFKDNNQDLITYRQGKRCWINQEIFGIKNDREQMEKRSPISFAAGDSDTDVFFVRDAHDMHVVIDRNKTEIMCLALANADGQWIVNPMFIEPKPPKTGAYECKTN